MINDSKRLKTVISFMMNGEHYISSNASRNTTYSFDDKNWRSERFTARAKVHLVLSKQVKKVKVRKKYEDLYETV